MLDLKALSHPLILDGATGTGLQKRGMPAGCCTEEWVLAHPEALLELQRSYVAAGTQALIAPTFGANRIMLSRHGLGERVGAYNRRLVALSREAADGRAFVLGDLSPTGLTLGDGDCALFERLFENFREQAEVLEAAGVDAFLVETQMALCETRAAVTAVREVSKKPLLVSFTLGASGKLLSGGDLCAALFALESFGIDAFGVNCVGDLPLLIDAIAALRKVTALPLIAKPNAGLPVTTEGGVRYTLSPEELAEAGEKLAKAGASLIGGCCGTDERHIRALTGRVGALPLPKADAPSREWICSEYASVPLDTLDLAALPELAPDGEAEELCEDAPAVRITIHERSELDALLEAQISLRVPTVVSIPEGELRRDFLRYYRGRAKLLP